MVSFACEGAVGPFDTALTSFAAHHLKSPEEKGRFLAGVRRHLKPGGTLYIVDVFRRNGVSFHTSEPGLESGPDHGRDQRLCGSTLAHSA